MEKRNPLRIMRWLLAGVTVLVAALLILQCAEIYFAGTADSNMAADGTCIQAIYSRAIVKERLQRIAWAGILWLAVLLAALFFRGKETAGKPIPGISTKTRLALLTERRMETPAMAAERKKRRIANIVAYGVCAACAGFIAAYFLDLRRFASRDLEAVVGKMLLYCLPPVAVGLMALIVLSRFSRASMLREIELTKTAGKRAPEPAVSPDNRKKNFLRMALYVAAAALLISGVQNGGMRDVLVKAINICTECIGLG